MGLEWENVGNWHIHGKDCMIYLLPRPKYCDRGNYLCSLISFDNFRYEIDDADLWPRIYFKFETAKEEVVLWLKTRKQFVPEQSKWTKGEGDYNGKCCDEQ